MRILMAAAENDALPGGKVGGIGDVVRDIPLALADIGQQVDVVIPSYGCFSQLKGAALISTVEVSFCGRLESIEIFKITLDKASPNVNQWVFEHPLFSIGGKGNIYCNDPYNRPFSTDATKFALFSVAIAKAVVNGVFGKLNVIHLHDWHVAIVSVLKEYHPEYQALQSIKSVYTIHNLALQGIRPYDGDESSLRIWFPELVFDYEDIIDPRYPNCFNPVRAGINLSDHVHAVSPNYAEEILTPSRPSQGYFGGEGLEHDLEKIASLGKLHGILNGCEYPKKTYIRLTFKKLISICEEQVLNWVNDKPLVDNTHLIAMTRMKQITTKAVVKKPIIVTSVGRITDQKVRLFQQVMSNGEVALTQLLNSLGDKGIFILLGSGDATLENFLTNIAAKHSNFIFLKGYSETLSENIYNSGDLFLMPSSFEPCGISQMLSMRAGQAVLANSVGGLTDTIIDNDNGFLFCGETSLKQAENMLKRFEDILTLKNDNVNKWKNIAKNARNAKFLWRDAAQDYVNKMYLN